MTYNTNPSNAASTGKGKAPTHAAYHVRETKDGKGFWTKVGAAWTHADGQGFNVQLDCVPLDGRVTLRVVSDKKE